MASQDPGPNCRAGRMRIETRTSMKHAAFRFDFYGTRTHTHSCVYGVNQGLLFVLPLFGHSSLFKRPHWFCTQNPTEDILGVTFSWIPFVYVLGLNA